MTTWSPLKSGDRLHVRGIHSTLRDSAQYRQGSELQFCPCAKHKECRPTLPTLTITLFNFGVHGRNDVHLLPSRHRGRPALSDVFVEQLVEHSLELVVLLAFDVLRGRRHEQVLHALLDQIFVVVDHGPRSYLPDHLNI